MRTPGTAAGEDASVNGGREDVGAFVEVRWPELHAVAVLALLDGERAREVAAAALTDVSRRWSEVSGAPTTAARRRLLEHIARPPRSSRGTRRPTARDRPPAADRPVDPDLRAAATDPDSAVPGTLLDALAEETPLVRATIAAELLWHLDPAEVTALAPGSAAELSDAVDRARGRLVVEHRTALARDGAPPADHRLGDDLARLVDRLVAATPWADGPALVADRVRAARRRSRLDGTVAVAAVVAGIAAGAAGAVLGATERSPAPDGATLSASPTAPPDWSNVGTWWARGNAASDPVIRQLVANAAPGSRLVFAGDLEDVRAVVAARAPLGFADSTTLSVWVGPAGADVGELRASSYELGDWAGPPDSLAVGLDAPGAGRLLVLGRPDASGVELSPSVLPQRDGTLERTWEPVPLEDGVGSIPVDAPLGLATRVRVSGSDVRPALPTSWLYALWSVDELASADGDRPGPFDETVAEITALTGITRSDLDEQVLVDTTTSVQVFDQPSARESSRVRFATFTTPQGAVLRSLRVGTRADVVSVHTPPTLVPAGAADAPEVLWVEQSGDERLLVVTPETTATRIRVDWGDPTDGDVVTVEGLIQDGFTVLTAPRGSMPDDIDRFRVVLRDEAGEVRYDGVTPRGLRLDSDG